MSSSHGMCVVDKLAATCQVALVPWPPAKLCLQLLARIAALAHIHSLGAGWRQAYTVQM